MAKDGGAQTSIYFNAEDHEVLAVLQERSGLGRSAVVRWAIHNAYQEGDTTEVERMAKIRSAAEDILTLTQT